MIRHANPAASRRVLGRMILVACLAAGWAPVAFSQAASGVIGAVGKIQAQGGNMALSAAGAQLVERVLVREGDQVRKGDVLIVFADRHLREMERTAAQERLNLFEETFAARLKVAELELETARSNLRAAREDVKAIEGTDDLTVAVREKRGRVQQLAGAELALHLSEAKVAELKRSQEPERRQLRSQIELAQAQLARTVLTAPISGTVIEVPARAGVMGGGTLVTLADTAVMQVVADVFEGDLARIAVGGKARIKNVALRAQLTGTVERIGRTVDAGSRLAKVTIRLDQPSPADRYLGMQVEVSIDATANAK